MLVMWEDMKEIAAIQKDRVETVSFRRQPRKNITFICFLVSSQNPDVPTGWCSSHTQESSSFFQRVETVLPVSGVYESCAALNMVMFAFVPCKDSQGELDCTQMSL